MPVMLIAVGGEQKFNVHNKYFVLIVMRCYHQKVFNYSCAEWEWKGPLEIRVTCLLHVPPSHVINIQKFFILLTRCTCVIFFCGPQNQQRLFACAASTDWLLGAYVKLRKATISFFIFVRPSVCPPLRPNGTTAPPPKRTDFHEI